MRGWAYVVADANETQGEPVTLNEVEIDILLRSKAAMYTILRTVMLQVGLEFEDLAAFYVAGAFGNVIDPHTGGNSGHAARPPKRALYRAGQFIPGGMCGAAYKPRLPAPRWRR